jgi:hypothetical protein
MNWTNTDNYQTYMPTGIHWQVAQATSLQNLYFNMSTSTNTQTTTAVGIYMENGSGGFVSGWNSLKVETMKRLLILIQTWYELLSLYRFARTSNRGEGILWRKYRIQSR